MKVRLWLCALTFGALTGLAPAQPPTFLRQAEEVIASVSDRLKPTVVHIESWSKRSGRRVKSLGSGVVVDAKGRIVTNHHVIDKAEQILVVLDDKSRHEAVVLRKDVQTDLAVIQISLERPLPFAVFADSDRSRVGQWVLAIGNPYGLDRTVSFGIISGKGRYMPNSDSQVTPLNDFLQTDAMIDPGSSGGPLVDLEGRVLGINSSGIGRGIGFTIPAKVVQEVLSAKQQQGQLERGWLGLYTQPLTRELARYWNLSEVHGILISDLSPNSPGISAGLQSGDIVTELNGESVEAEQEDEIQRFAQQVSRLSPGSRANLVVKRGKQTLSLQLIVGQQPHLQGAELETPYGFKVAEITNYRQQQYRLSDTTGLVVTDVESGSLAEEAGVEAGDRLIAVEGHEIQQLSDLEGRLQPTMSSGLLLRFRKGQYSYYALMRPRAKK